MAGYQMIVILLMIFLISGNFCNDHILVYHVLIEYSGFMIFWAFLQTIGLNV